MKKQRAQLNQEDDGEEGGDDWLLTYGDLMTQLVCFFVLLMSFSVVSSMKFRDVVVSLHEALAGQGVLDTNSSTIEDIPLDLIRRMTPRVDESLLILKEEIEETLEEMGMSSHVEVEIRQEGLVIILKQRNPPVFFDTADAHIKEQAYPILDQIGKIMKALANDISVEGHTDIRPINTPQFPSNWELSIIRATNVLKYLQKTTGIAPGKFSAVGYGPYRPIATNDTETGMSRNRRVEIVILRMDEESIERLLERESVLQKDDSI